MSDLIKRYNAPLQFGLMLVIIIATLLAGYLMYPGSEEERQSLLGRLGTSNKGVLLSPTLNVHELGLTHLDGTPWRLPEDSLKWRMLIPAVGQCGEQCRERLHITRQIHVRLNKQAPRVERAFISLEGGASPELLEYLEQDHPRTLILNAERSRFEAWLAGSQLDWRPDEQVVILLDPLGQAMMFYTRDHSGTDILLDLEHLLKYSPQ